MSKYKSLVIFIPIVVFMLAACEDRNDENLNEPYNDTTTTPDTRNTPGTPGTRNTPQTPGTPTTPGYDNTPTTPDTRTTPDTDTPQTTPGTSNAPNTRQDAGNTSSSVNRATDQDIFKQREHAVIQSESGLFAQALVTG